MKKSLLIPLILSLSSNSFAFNDLPLPDTISLIPSVVKDSNASNPLNFKEHWALTTDYLQTLKNLPKLIGDFNVNTGQVGINHNTEHPKINSVVFGTTYTA